MPSYYFTFLLQEGPQPYSLAIPTRASPQSFMYTCHVMTGRTHRGERDHAMPPLCCIKRLGTHPALQDGEEIRPKHKQNLTCASTHKLLSTEFIHLSSAANLLL